MSRRRLIREFTLDEIQDWEAWYLLQHEERQVDFDDFEE